MVLLPYSQKSMEALKFLGRKGVVKMADTQTGKFEKNDQATRDAAKRGGESSGGSNRDDM